MLAGPLGRLVGWCARNAWIVVLIAALFGVAAVLATKTRLGVSTDTDQLFSASLPWEHRSNVLAKDFPQNNHLLIAVIDGNIPEQQKEAAAELAVALRKQADLFETVRVPSQNPYLVRNALLFLDPAPLQKLLNATLDAQPFLGQLAADPSARGLFEALGLIGQGVASGDVNTRTFHAPLQAFAANLTVAANGQPTPLSWQRLLTGSLSDQGGKYQFVIAQPRLNYGSFAPGGEATDAMKRAIASLPDVKSGVVRVFITGPVAIDDQEFATVAKGAMRELLFSLVLVTLWLFLAVRSWRIIVPMVLVLLFGLLLTTGFAALAVGTLNLVSVAFAVLFIGIAVDFAIQFSVRFRSQRDSSGAPLPREAALAATGRETGVQILIAALATACGFLAFTPTAFIGVAQLGLIAGVGMLIAFVSSMTVLPALLRLFGFRSHAKEEGFAWAGPADRALRRHRRPVMFGAALIALTGAALLPQLKFDGDPLHTKNPNSPAIRALHLLLANPNTSQYGAEALVANSTEAQRLAKRLKKLPLVGNVMTLDSFMPDDQAQKLPSIQQAASILLPSLAAYDVRPAPDAAQIRASMVKAVATLTPNLTKLPPDDPLRAIVAALRRLSTQPDKALLTVNRDLVRYLPMQLQTLLTVLQADPVTLHDIPPDITRDWLLPDGQARIEIDVKGAFPSNHILRKFLAEVRTILPDVSGDVVVIIESANTIVSAFKTAALSALGAIALMLLLTLRRPRDMALVLAPLLLSATLTIVLCVTLAQPLNFANIIALPLLLGVGVSFNIYFVMNWRAGLGSPLASPTAKAILFSALTTGTAFGSLAMSEHPGTASMGRLLLISLGCTLLATLVFEPALLPRRKQDTE